MRAIQITSYDGPDAIELNDVQPPTITRGQVLIDVRAAGVAFPELLQTKGLYQMKPDLPYVPGTEVAGVVLDADPETGFAPGDRVAAVSVVGGFAERVVVDAGSAFSIPDRVSFEEGAALPLNYLTAHFALVSRGRLAEGETVLVHGAAGGVGTASIQVAKVFGAGTVIAVVSTAEKGEVAIAAGADHFVLADGFRDQVKSITGGRGVDIVVDPVGGDRFTDSLRSLAEDGRALVIGFSAGDIPTVQVNRLLLNNIDVVGIGWGAYVLKRPGYIATQWAELAPYLESGELRPPVGATFALADAAEALRAIDERRATGKVVLTIS